MERSSHQGHHLRPHSDRINYDAGSPNLEYCCGPGSSKCNQGYAFYHAFCLLFDVEPQVTAMPVGTVLTYPRGTLAKIDNSKVITGPRIGTHLILLNSNTPRHRQSLHVQPNVEARHSSHNEDIRNLRGHHDAKLHGEVLP